MLFPLAEYWWFYAAFTAFVLVLLAIVPCLLLVHAFFRGKILHASRVQQETFSRVTSALAETVQGIRVTQGFAREDTNAGIFTRLVRSLAGNVVKTASLTSLYLPLLELNAHGFMAALIGVGGWAALSGTGTGLGDLVTFFFLADLFFSPITIIGTQLSEATLAMAGAERYFRVLDTPPAWTDRPDAAECPRLNGHVEFRDVGFAYVPDRPVLHEICFTAEPGKVIALVGHTGSGKSTIIGLLAKFQLPLSGQVLVDGHDLAGLRQDTLRRQMGFVFQQNFLFAGTIAENVKAARPEATDEEIRQAFRDLDCLDLIEALPEGIHTPCSEKGRGLSMGQQQLVAFARALLADPRILVLDEATSALDAESERLVQGALEVAMLGRTTLVIAHRLATVQRATRIIVMEHGCIVETGTHASLVAQGGLYASLAALQFTH